MEEYGNNGIFVIDRKLEKLDAGGGRETGNLFGVA